MQMKGKKQQKFKSKDIASTKADFNLGNGSDRHEKKSSADTLKGNFVPFPSTSHSQELSDGVIGDLESDSSASDSESDTDHYHRSAGRKENTLSNMEGNALNKSYSSTSGVPPSRDTLSVSTPSKKNSVVVDKKAKTNVLSNKSEVESASCTKIPNENNNNISGSLVSPNIATVQLEGDKNSSDEKSAITSDRNSSDCSFETSDMESNGNEIFMKTGRDQVRISLEIATKYGEICHEPIDNSSKGLQLHARSPRTKDESKATENPHKQKHSNEKRLDALKDKKKTVLAQRNVIKDALKCLDSGTESHDGKKHIVFSDNDNDDVRGYDVKEKAAYSIGDKVRIFDFYAL